MNKINKEKMKRLIQPIVLTILGLLFIIFSNSITNYLVLILGIAIFGYGLSHFLIALFNRKRVNITVEYYKGGLGVIVGLLFMISRQNLVNILIVFAGLFAVVSSLVSLYVIMKAYSSSKERNIRFIFEVIELILGLVLILAPQTSLSLICILIGVYLLYKGIVIGYSVIFLKEPKNFSFFYHKETSNSSPKKDPNIIDHDEITDDHIIKK